MSALLDVDQLKTFVAIVDTGSFTRAADKVNKTQSAVSMQMKRLEERVGKPIFARDGRQSRLTDDGERLLDYARRIVQLSGEAMMAMADEDLAGRVRLGIPDDYADRYLPEILARFSRSYPRAEVTVFCEPSVMLSERIKHDGLDLAIITRTDHNGPSLVVRQEQLIWVTSSRSAIHDNDVVPLALARPPCVWRSAAVGSLESAGRPYRVLYTSWSGAAVGAAVLAGLAVSVLAESSLRPGMRVLGPVEGYPALPPVQIALLRNQQQTPLANALADHIVASLDNLAETVAAQ